MRNILVTGGTGFIGSHTCISLLEKGFKLWIIDSNVNSMPISLEKVKLILREKIFDLNEKLTFIKGDIRDEKLLETIFCEASNQSQPIDAVIHFAGLKAVAEAVSNPIKYWENNVIGSISLLKVKESFISEDVSSIFII